MRLRMRVSFLFFSFCLNLKQHKLPVHGHWFCLHFMWFVIGAALSRLFIYLFVGASKMLKNFFPPSQSSAIHSFFIFRNLYFVFWFLFVLIWLFVFTFYYRFLIVEPQNCCRCNSIQWCFVFISHTIHKKIYFIFEWKKKNNNRRWDWW